MSSIVYRIHRLLEQMLAQVGVGTNLALYYLLWSLLSGRFLLSRGAVFAALADLGLPPEAVRRSGAALAYGDWQSADLLVAWQALVAQEGDFHAHRHAGFCPVACDLVGFFRPRLQGCGGKHYHSQADKALPAVVLGLVGCVGSVGKQRLCLPRLLVRPDVGDTSEKALMRKTLRQAGVCLRDDEVLVTDAGFSLSDVLACEVARFVVRRDKNFTARRNRAPAYSGQGRPPKKGEIVRPLARSYRGKNLPATPADKVVEWVSQGRRIRAAVFLDLVLPDAKPGCASFWCAVIVDPRYKEPLVLATNLPVSAFGLAALYRDRWPIEQLPLAAKQMLGAERAFVFGKESRYRLPELTLLAGNLLSYGAATSQPVATGFWDRCARPTCGRLRRVLLRLRFSELPPPGGQLHKKSSPTAHLPKGVKGHRRHKAVTGPWDGYRKAA